MTQTLTTAPVKETEKAPFIRTKDGCFKLQKSNYWGEYYVPIKDPKGVDKPAEVDYMWLKEQFDRLPFHLLQGIVTFFRSYMSTNGSAYVVGSTEVQVCLLRGVDDPSQWKVVVPMQSVTSVTVDAVTTHSCDLFTGEEYTVFPPEGYCHSGSIHSHNSMSAFWSGRDDQGELGVPGMHCTIGMITPHSFDICCSIVLNKKRYIFRPDLLLNLDGVATVGSNDKCKVMTIYDSKVAEISSLASTYVTRATAYSYRGVGANSWVTKYKGPKNVTLMPRDQLYGIDEWDDWDDTYYNAGWYGNYTYTNQANKFRDYEKDIKHELKHEVEFKNFRDQRTVDLNGEEKETLKDILTNLDIYADALMACPRGQELLAALLAQKLDLNVYMPVAEDIINTCLY
jgi:hypothetical protein